MVWIQTPHSGIAGPRGPGGGIKPAVGKLRRAQNRPGPTRGGTRARQPMKGGVWDIRGQLVVTTQNVGLCENLRS